MDSPVASCLLGRGSSVQASHPLPPSPLPMEILRLGDGWQAVLGLTAKPGRPQRSCAQPLWILPLLPEREVKDHVPLRALSGWGLYLPLEPIHWCYGFTHQCFELGKGESSPEDEKSGFWACRAPELTQHTGEVTRVRDATLGAPRWHRPVISAWHQSPFYISSSSARKWRKLKSSEQ